MAFCSLAWLTLICACAFATEELHHKRAPSGFTGMRGKKSIPDSAFNEDTRDSGDAETPRTFGVQPMLEPVDMVEKRKPMGFMGMRGKKPDTYGVYPPSAPDPNYSSFGDVWLKRAPSGFFGMRGKKEYEDYPKRAPSGFFGMRGKKESVPLSYFGSKRTPMGFVGMRGKKSTDVIEEEKRAPSAFFGMRGKKPAGFFGMRGKKYPFEFRGKFIGVRGKKTSNSVTRPDFDLDLGRLGEELDINQLMLLLTEQNESESDTDWNNINDGLISQ